jgi:hypothetical protein
MAVNRIKRLTCPSNAGGTVYSQQGQSRLRKLFDRETFSRVEFAHGVLATMTFATFFPLGAIAIRAIPGRLALGVHLLLQILGYATCIAAYGMGIWMVHTFEPFGADFVGLAHEIV